MIRICFERLPCYRPIDTVEDFTNWLTDNISVPFIFGGYIVLEVSDVIFGQNVTWNIIIEDQFIPFFSNNNCIINGYVIHAYDIGELRETKIKTVKD